MNISQNDFNRAVKAANDAGKRGKDIQIQYIPPNSATQIDGVLILDEYSLTTTGGRS